ncbi:tetratricopeptide repeat protein [Saccharospirillum mangrovi]|uniref:tetratricopeptide repeat protein n=1 Tax=Saccharospirillum mangrovi TaxID=2161747 RepID=UPI0013008DF6|nr:tetratricopeptide repeat protein [Saccharospirillum mangrovi]
MSLAACQSNPPAPVVFAPTQAFGTIDMMAQADQLQDAIRAHDFSTVSESLAPCLSQPENEPALELRCAHLYQAVAVLDEPLLNGLQQWLVVEPMNYHARMLMGQAKLHAAWAEQGRHYPRNTPLFYRQRASAFRSLGQAHLDIAINLHPELPFAYASAIQLLSDEEALDGAEQLFQRARFWVPGSLVVAQAYLDASQTAGLGVYGRLNTVAADYQQQNYNTESADWLAAYADFLQVWSAPANGAIFQNPQQALTQLQRLVDQGYRWPRLYWSLADVNARLDQMDAARDAMLKAIDAAPYDEFILATAACTCFGLQLDEAVALNERYVERFPTAFYGWRNLARDYLNQGDYPATLNAARTALALRPLDAEMRRYRRGTLAVLGQTEETVEDQNYYQSLALDGLQLELQMAQVRNGLREQIEPRLTAAQLHEFDLALVDYLNAQTLTPLLAERFNDFHWDTDTWHAVSTFLVDQAGIADELDDDYRQSVRLRFPIDQDGHAVAELDHVFRQTVNALVQEFIYRQSQQLPITGSGMTS